MATEMQHDELGRGSTEGAHVNMVIYGRSGAGKTYWASTAPGIYVMAADPKGHDSIPYKAPGKLTRCLADAAKVLEWLEAGGHVEKGIRTLLVDGLNFIYDMFYEEVGAEIVARGSSPSLDRLAYSGGMEVQRPYGRFLKRLVNLTTIEPKEYRVNVVFTTLEERHTPTEKMPYSVNPYFGTKSMNQLFPALFSVIAYIVPIGDETTDEDGKIIVDQTRRVLFTEYAGILARDKLGIFPTSGDAPNLSEYLK